MVDVVADTAVSLKTVTLSDFQAHAGGLPEPSRSLLLDLARSQRQQTELASSRLAKDADARCAQWLMQLHDAASRPVDGLRVWTGV